MLSFVEKYDSLPPKISKRCFPELKSGVSYEAPLEFHSSHGRYCQNSYNNPHLEPIHPDQFQDIVPIQTNPIYIQTRNIRDIEDPESKDNEFMLNYRQQLSKSPRQFKRKKGLFVDFIDRNQWQMKHNLVSKERLRTQISRQFRTRSRTIEVPDGKKSSSVASINFRKDLLEPSNKIATRASIESRLDTITKSASSLSGKSPLLQKSRLRSQRMKFSEQTSLLLDKRKLKPGMQVTKTTFPLINKLKLDRQEKSRSNLEQTIIRERINIIRAPWYHSKLPMSNDFIEESLQ